MRREDELACTECRVEDEVKGLAAGTAGVYGLGRGLPAHPKTDCQLLTEKR